MHADTSSRCWPAAGQLCSQCTNAQQSSLFADTGSPKQPQFIAIPRLKCQPSATRLLNSMHRSGRLHGAGRAAALDVWLLPMGTMVIRTARSTTMLEGSALFNGSIKATWGAVMALMAGPMQATDRSSRRSWGQAKVCRCQWRGCTGFDVLPGNGRSHYCGGGTACVACAAVLCNTMLYKGCMLYMGCT